MQETGYGTAMEDSARFGSTANFASTKRESCRPLEQSGTPLWLSNQTAPRVLSPPRARVAAPGYQGHSPLIQKEIEDDETSVAAQPQILLRSYRMQRPPVPHPDDLRLTQTFAMGETEQRIARAKHMVGYTGFQRGNKCKEDLPDLERTSELEILLRQLSKGINGSTHSGYDILRTMPTTSVQQELHCTQVPTAKHLAGVKMHKRLQSPETAYADAYCKLNQGIGPFAPKNKAPADKP